MGDPVKAQLNRAIEISGVSILKGATVDGRIKALEQYYEPEKYFSVGLEFSSLTFGGGRAVFHARLVGPRLAGEKRRDPNAMGIGTTTTARTDKRGLDIDDSSSRAGAFRVRGGRLRLTRGFHMIFETEENNQ